MDKIEELLTRGVEKIYPSKEGLQKFLPKRKLNVYLGIDPTATRIHLGHSVPLRKLQKFAELGHNVTFLIGNFTAMIGDTSDKDSERPALNREEIEDNFKTYKSQAEKIIDFSKVKIQYNNDWLSKLNFEEILKLAQNFSLSDFINRDFIKRRLNENKRVGLQESLYPLMQGYDSYYLDTDLQIGGEDQELNMQAGRILQKKLRNKETYLLVTEILAGIDGRKMSKTWNNAIWLDNDPIDMYAKIMAIHDNLIMQYYTLATNLSASEIKKKEDDLKSGTNPMEVKKDLAYKITEELHNKSSADKAKDYFENVIQKQKNPFELPPIMISRTAISGASVARIVFETGIVRSMSQAKRVIQQGGTEVNDQIVSDPNESFENYLKGNEAVIKVGKTNFVKVKTK